MLRLVAKFLQFANRIRMRFQGKRYGLLTPTDVGALEWVLDRLLSTPYDSPIRILEIGIWRGDTAAGIRDYIERHGRVVEYVGIDLGKDWRVIEPWWECRLIRGDSIYVSSQVPDDYFDLLFIDGCHCKHHVTGDFLEYGKKVRQTGFCLFHDTSPLIPIGHEFQGIHDVSTDVHVVDNRDIHSYSRYSIQGMLDNKYFDGWSKVADVWCADKWCGIYGGIMGFRKGIS